MRTNPPMIASEGTSYASADPRAMARWSCRGEIRGGAAGVVIGGLGIATGIGVILAGEPAPGAAIMALLCGWCAIGTATGAGFLVAGVKRWIAAGAAPMPSGERDVEAGSEDSLVVANPARVKSSRSIDVPDNDDAIRGARRVTGSRAEEASGVPTAR